MLLLLRLHVLELLGGRAVACRHSLPRVEHIVIHLHGNLLRLPHLLLLKHGSDRESIGRPIHRLVDRARLVHERGRVLLDHGGLLILRLPQPLTAVIVQVSRQQTIDIAGRPRYATHRLVVLARVVERSGHLFRHVVEALRHELRRRLLVRIVLRRGIVQHRVTTALA